MRLRPPRSRKKTFKGEKEITKFLLGYEMICADGEIIPASLALLEMLENYPTPEKCLAFFVDMFPQEHKSSAYTVYEKYLEEKLGVKMGIWISAWAYRANEMRKK